MRARINQQVLLAVIFSSRITSDNRTDKRSAACPGQECCIFPNTCEKASRNGQTEPESGRSGYMYREGSRHGKIRRDTLTLHLAVPVFPGYNSRSPGGADHQYLTPTPYTNSRYPYLSGSSDPQEYSTYSCSRLRQNHNRIFRMPGGTRSPARALLRQHIS